MPGGRARVPRAAVSAPTRRQSDGLGRPRLRNGPGDAYILGMTRTLLLSMTLLAAFPAWAQEAAVTPTASGATASAAEAEAAPTDPVAAWEAEPAVILDAGEIELSDFEYVARPLVIFADNPRQPQFIEQMRMIEAAIGDLSERDVAVIVDSDPDARSAIRQELRPRGFGVVLVDKDGRVTLRQPGPTAVREIARAIDRTPIRQEELRNGRTATPLD